MNGNANQASSIGDRQNKGQPVKWWQWFVVYPSVAIAVVGAVPQYLNVFKGWSIGLPASEVPEARSQNKLWERNVGCQIDLHEVEAQGNILLSVGACPTGDVQVTVKSAEGASTVRWIAFETLQTARSNFWSLVIPSAIAEEEMPSTLRLAQTQTQVICQRRLGPGKILRRIRDGDNCHDEIVNTYTGRVEERRPADCSPSC